MAAASRWKKMEEVSPRIKHLRDGFLRTVPEISVDRAVLVTESYERTFGQPFITRRAQALRNVLRNMRIHIQEGELLVGGLAEKPRAAPLFPEYDVGFILDELDTLETRVADRFLISEENKARLREVLPKWRGNTVCDQALRTIPDSCKQSANEMVFILTALRSGVGHTIVDYAPAIDNGLLSLVADAERLRGRIPQSDPHLARKRNYAVGIANVADSLAAIKQRIHDQRSLTWHDLKDALLNNFEGHECLRQELLSRVPKYGNDVDYVDSLGEEVHDFLYREMKKYANPRAGPYRNALYSIACHVLFADRVGATPDGRKRGMVLADGGVSCSQGRDKSGPTALLKSVTALDPYKAVGSTLLNLKLHPEVFKDPSGYGKIASLIKTYFLLKGQHVQFNVIDAQTLRDAQKHPDRYASLVVRVAGFSVLFTTIDPLLQEDIILRTEIQSG